MKITIDKEKKGLVRIVIGVSCGSGCLSTDYDDCEKRGNIRAVGFWHRHDDNDVEETLSNEAEWIIDAYRKMWEYSGAIVGVEWKDYRKLLDT